MLQIYEVYKNSNNDSSGTCYHEIQNFDKMLLTNKCVMSSLTIKRFETAVVDINRNMKTLLEYAEKLISLKKMSEKCTEELDDWVKFKTAVCCVNQVSR